MMAFSLFGAKPWPEPVMICASLVANWTIRNKKIFKNQTTRIFIKENAYENAIDLQNVTVMF